MAAWWLRAYTTHAEELSVIPSTRVGWLTQPAGNSSSRVFDILTYCRYLHSHVCSCVYVGASMCECMHVYVHLRMLPSI